MIPAFVATSHRRRSLVHRSRRARDRIPTIFFDGRPLSSSSRQARGTRATSRRAARRRPSSPPSRLRSALRRASARSRTPTPRRATRRSVVGQCIDLDLALVPPFVNPPQCVRVCVCVLDVRARSRARFAVREFAASCVSRLVNAPQCVCVCVCVCMLEIPSAAARFLFAVVRAWRFFGLATRPRRTARARRASGRRVELARRALDDARGVRFREKTPPRQPSRSIDQSIDQSIEGVRVPVRLGCGARRPDERDVRPLRRHEPRILRADVALRRGACVFDPHRGRASARATSSCARGREPREGWRCRIVMSAGWVVGQRLIIVNSPTRDVSLVRRRAAPARRACSPRRCLFMSWMVPLVTHALSSSRRGDELVAPAARRELALHDARQHGESICWYSSSP